jgi:putative flippase GtrA
MSAARGAFLRFCLVGVVGFGADAGLTLLFTQAAEWPALPSRIAAFLLAATATWLLNRRYTFRSTAGARSWMPYVAATSLGAVINISVYWLWLRTAGESPASILGGVALGSVVALTFNYFASRAIFLR